MKHPVIAVALSGGVDSLVSGHLIKQKYKNIFGLHFITGYEKQKTNVKLLEQQLDFPVTCIDLSNDFEKNVIHYFVNTYLDGKTPNPCMVCNKTIKFGTLLDHARAMGADYLATGHYATIINEFSSPEASQTGAYLKKGEDPLKDQSYFLSLLSKKQLEHIFFPLAQMKKKEVKQYAVSNNIAPLYPSESQDICFIHDNNFSQFILDKIKRTPRPGEIIDPNGTVVGQHTGLHRYTIGQRRGLNCPAKEPYYVKKIHIKTNQLEVCFKKELLQQQFRVKNINWNYSACESISDIMTKIRYSHKGAQSTLCFEGNTGNVVFDTPQNAVTPGQAAVFYKEDRVLGAGIIQ